MIQDVHIQAVYSTLDVHTNINDMKEFIYPQTVQMWEGPTHNDPKNLGTVRPRFRSQSRESLRSQSGQGSGHSQDKVQATVRTRFRPQSGQSSGYSQDKVQDTVRTKFRPQSGKVQAIVRT
jgi:hypothetical protein